MGMDAGALAPQVAVVGFHEDCLSILDTKVEEEHSKVSNQASSIAAVDAKGEEGKSQKVVEVVPGKSFDPQATKASQVLMMTQEHPLPCKQLEAQVKRDSYLWYDYLYKFHIQRCCLKDTLSEHVFCYTQDKRYLTRDSLLPASSQI